MGKPMNIEGGTTISAGVSSPVSAGGGGGVAFSPEVSPVCNFSSFDFAPLPVSEIVNEGPITGVDIFSSPWVQIVPVDLTPPVLNSAEILDIPEPFVDAFSQEPLTRLDPGTSQPTLESFIQDQKEVSAQTSVASEVEQPMPDLRGVFTPEPMSRVAVKPLEQVKIEGNIAQAVKTLEALKLAGMEGQESLVLSSLTGEELKAVTQTLQEEIVQEVKTEEVVKRKDRQVVSVEDKAEERLVYIKDEPVNQHRLGKLSNIIRRLFRLKEKDENVELVGVAVEYGPETKADRSSIVKDKGPDGSLAMIKTALVGEADSEQDALKRIESLVEAYSAVDIDKTGEPVSQHQVLIVTQRAVFVERIRELMEKVVQKVKIEAVQPRVIADEKAVKVEVVARQEATAEDTI